MTSKGHWRRWSAGAVLAALLAGAGGLAFAHQGGSVSGYDTRALLAAEGPREERGAWYVPPLPPEEQRTQAVHTVVLPNGKVLIVNGSSNRNRRVLDEVREGVDVTNPWLVDNTALFDPSAIPLEDPSAGKTGDAIPTGWSRISSPPTSLNEAVDLFCAGHVHLSDGKVLFVSGTENYYPTEKFHGSRGAWTFDWRTAQWTSAGHLADGHWYPGVVSLGDGRVAIFSGIALNRFDNSPRLEVYDPAKPVAEAWSWVDLTKVPHSPFSTPVADGPRAPIDRLNNYPRLYPMDDGRIMVTGDGAGGGDFTTRNTYLVSIGPAKADGSAPEVTSALGPSRKAPRKSYGTAVLDPNTPGDILLLGGMAGSDNINYGPTLPPPSGDIRVTSDLERFTPTGAAQGADGAAAGTWAYVPDFLGDQPPDQRIMHNAVILPTKAILVVGGGNYAFHDPVVRPQLLTPDASAPGGYRTSWMNPGTQPRLYHNNALLLPDGRVFVAGGNSTRALVDMGSGKVALDIVRTDNATFKTVEKGRASVPAEVWQVELFYPSYLFTYENGGSGHRPVIIEAPETLAYGATASAKVDTSKTDGAALVLIKLGSATHGWDAGQRLSDLTFTDDGSNTLHFTAPTNRAVYTPGYYMLFYVDGNGVPSVAKMVRLEG